MGKTVLNTNEDFLTGEAERLKLMTFALQERGGEKSSRDGRPGERSPEYESPDCQKCGRNMRYLKWV